MKQQTVPKGFSDFVQYEKNYSETTACKVFLISKQFSWTQEAWCVPAIYICTGGVVVDIIRKFPYFSLKNRLSIYEKKKAEGSNSPMEQLLLETRNPYSFQPTAHLLYGENTLDAIHSERFNWNPYEKLSGRSDVIQDNVLSYKVVDHYGLDILNGWQVFRMYFEDKMAPLYEGKFALVLDAPDELLPGPTLKVCEPGESFVFKNPFAGKYQKLTVTVIEHNTLRQSESKILYPQNYAVMHYQLSPTLRPDKYCIMDTVFTDNPIKKQKNGNLVPILPGMRGYKKPVIPDDVLQTYSSDKMNRVAISALTYAPRETLTWQFAAIHKARKSVRVELNKG